MNNYSADTNDGGHLTILGFTPLIDEIVPKYDLSTAAVFGLAWRFCQQQHVGEASLAKTLGLTSRCVTNHLQKLVWAGLIIDQTPGLKHKPHAYAIATYGYSRNAPR